MDHFEDNQKFSHLMKQGDERARHGSPECLALFQAALSLAERISDPLRAGEAQLAIARAHLNVPQIRDLRAYERYARKAVRSGEQFSPFGADLISRGKLSVGNAIVEQLQESGERDPERLREARAALAYAATSDASDARTRASARNGLGNVARLEEKPFEAATQYLQAASDFEALGQTENLGIAQINAAVALAAAGDLEDARKIAAQARRTLAQAPHVDQRLHAVLETIAPSAEDK